MKMAYSCRGASRSKVWERGCQLARALSVSLLLMVTVTAHMSKAFGFAGEDVLCGRPWHHEDITKRALMGGEPVYEGAGFDPAAADAVAWHADYIDSYLYNPLFWAQGSVSSDGISSDRTKAALVGFSELAKLHFDDTFTIEGLRANWVRYAAGTLAGLYWAAMREGPGIGDVGAAHNIIGVSVHAVQDFYSHSNWVDYPYRRCMTWHQTEPARRNVNSPLYSGAYERTRSGAPRHHGAYSMACSLLRGDTMDSVLQPICGGLSPLQNFVICEEWRLCRNAGSVTVSVNHWVPENLVLLEPTGIALDSTWLSRVQAPERRLVTDELNFRPGKGGMYFPRSHCQSIIGTHSPHSTESERCVENEERPEVCTSDADYVFAGVKDLAIRATMEWIDYLDEVIGPSPGRAVDARALPPRQRLAWFWWERVKREGSAAGLASVQQCWQEDLISDPDKLVDAERTGQFEDLCRLPYQFLSAGPYPVVNPSAVDLESAASADGWYLRLRLRTGTTSGDGTDADVTAVVSLPSGETESIVLDHLPKTDRRGTTDNILLIYDDFEEGDDDTYTIGPFTERPQSLQLRNDAAGLAEALEALVDDLANDIVQAATSLRRTIFTVVAGGADFVGRAKDFLTARQISSALSSRNRIERTLLVDGGDQGVYEFTYQINEGTAPLTQQERDDGWIVVEIKAQRLKIIREASVDRLSFADEPFVVFLTAPYNGRTEQANAYLSDVIPAPDDPDEKPEPGGPASDPLNVHNFPRQTGSGTFIRLPPHGSVVMSVEVYEHDDDKAVDREQLRRTFASGADRETRQDPDRFLHTLGRLLGAPWRLQYIDVFAFHRGANVQAGEVFRSQLLGETIEADGESDEFTLQWDDVVTLLTEDQSIDSWTSTERNPWLPPPEDATGGQQVTANPGGTLTAQVRGISGHARVGLCSRQYR